LRNKEILVTEELTKRYSGYTALERLNLTVTEGTCVGFVGPNGAGKSTTIKILTGLIHPTNGKAFIAGYDIVNEKKQALSMIGAVVETPEFFPHFTPTEILSYFGKIRGLSTQSLTERIKKVLELVKMEDWSQKKIGKFSKGMKQRIALASALLHDPDLVILDEPTSGLDPRGMIEVRKIIKSLKEQGKTIFMSSQLLPKNAAVITNRKNTKPNGSEKNSLVEDGGSVPVSPGTSNKIIEIPAEIDKIPRIFFSLRDFSNSYLQIVNA